MATPQNGFIAEPMPDSLEGRMTSMEHNLYDAQARLARTEDSQAIILSKYQMLSETLVKCLQVGLLFFSTCCVLLISRSTTMIYPVHFYLWSQIQITRCIVMACLFVQFTNN